MKTNQAGVDLIKHFEGFVSRWYSDPVGVKTCCYGHTDSAGDPKYVVTFNKTFTKAEGEEILKRDLGQYESAVSNAVKVPLNDNQFAALVSFTYNLGAGNLRSSTLLRKLNAGDYKGAADQFLVWNKAGGKVLQGLVKRREAERDLFLSRPASGSAPTETEKGSIPAFIIALAAVIVTAAIIIMGGK